MVLLFLAWGGTHFSLITDRNYNVKNLYSDVSELRTLSGDKTLINDISVTLQKKKKLKQMQDNPTDFVTDVQGDYDPT